MHSTIPRSARHSWFALRLPRLPSGYHPQAHAKAKNDMKETLAEIFGNF
jgi:dienelactone hydrolase